MCSGTDVVEPIADNPLVYFEQVVALQKFGLLLRLAVSWNVSVCH